MSEAEAKRQGVAARVAKLPMKAVRRTATTDETQGFMKVLVGAGDDRILGFTMIGAEAGEVTTVVQTAMLAGLPYPKLRDAVIAWRKASARSSRTCRPDRARAARFIPGPELSAATSADQPSSSRLDQPWKAPVDVRAPRRGSRAATAQGRWLGPTHGRARRQSAMRSLPPPAPDHGPANVLQALAQKR